MEETTVLIARAQSGDKEAREVLVEKNLGLVHHIVKRFLGRGYDAEDLFQIGSIGLMKAVDKFDLSFDVKFSTYAVPMITGEIKRFLRDDGLIKMSRVLKENGAKIARASACLGQDLGREATISEIAAATELTEEEVVEALEANTEVESIYKTVYQGDGSEITLADRISDRQDGTDEVVNHLVLRQAMDGLEAQERELIYLRYYQDKTQVEVAGRLGISQVQVSRLEKRILLRMRERMS